MTDSLQTILGGRDFLPPAELKAVKDFILEKFDSEVQVGLKDKHIVIIAANSSLAGTLRLYSEDIRRHARTTRKLIIRIG